MAPVEDVVPVWLGSEGVSHSVLPAVATISRPHAALAVNSVRMAVLFNTISHFPIYNANSMTMGRVYSFIQRSIQIRLSSLFAKLRQLLRETWILTELSLFQMKQTSRNRAPVKSKMAGRSTSRLTLAAVTSAKISPEGCDGIDLSHPFYQNPLTVVASNR